MNIERRKIEYVTEIIGEFRGLPIMFFGLAMCVFSIIHYLSELDAQKRNHYGRDLTYSGTFLLVCLLFYIFAVPKIRGYYREKYGQAQRKSSLRDKLKCLFYLVPWLIAYSGGTRIDTNFALPVSVTVLFIAIFAFGLWWANQRGVSNFFLYISAVLLGLSFLPWEKIYLSITVLDDYSGRMAFYTAACYLFYGIVSFLFGAFDHWLLVKTLIPVVREGEIYESV